MNPKQFLAAATFGALCALFAATAPAQAQEVEGDSEAAAHAAVPTQRIAERHAHLLDDDIEAATALVERLRSGGESGEAMGYGEIDITLGLAGAMIESGSAADLDAALDSLLQMRADGMGWGEIAQELGFNLGQIVSAANRGSTGAQGQAGLDIAAEARGTAGGGAGATTAADARVRGEVGRGVAAEARGNARIEAGTRPVTPARPENVGRPVLPERPLMPERPTRPERPDRPQRGGR
ncbi:hypothetical protein [Rehaibacterium terrae]|uniref:hypothetical protein n=1 Tax=Rehaibacterium terrae TaxID=1341696 RepID=UPI00391DF6DE